MVDGHGSHTDGVSLGRLALVIWPAYGVLAFSEFVSWKLKSAPAVTSIAAFVAGTAVVMGGVGFLRAKNCFIDFEAHSSKDLPIKRSEKRTRKLIKEWPTASIPRYYNGDIGESANGANDGEVKIKAPRAAAADSSSLGMECM
jgi:hypothetical protein